MKIEGVQRFLSCNTFSKVELPSFVVLIGRNGSGKSHLLKAIENGAVHVDVAGSDRATSILLIENNGHNPNGLTEKVQSSIASSESSFESNFSENPVFENYENYRNNKLRELREALIGNLPQPLADYYRANDPWRAGPREFQNTLYTHGVEKSYDDIEAIFAKARETLAEFPEAGKFGPDIDLYAITNGLREIAIATSKDALAVAASDFQEYQTWGGFSSFDPRVSAYFSRYRDALLRNYINQKRHEADASVRFMSDKEFQGAFGLEPWAEVTELLQNFGLPYRVQVPDIDPHVPVQFRLVRNRDGEIIEFSALSSGEKVIIRFLLAVFRFDPLRLRIHQPKLLLLDEMDASLHPELLNRWLNAIQRELVDNRGICCILTSHSPTTVALVPPNSLWEMVEGTAGPQKIGKQEAVDRLTFGVPSLAVDFDHRRQVFVESGTDAKTFETILNIVRSDLNLRHSVTFITTGPRKENQERNTGGDFVKHLVKEFDARGNTSVYGVIDWDANNARKAPSPRVIVFAEGSHYALDNVVLTPLLAGALLVRVAGSVVGSPVRIQDLSSLTFEQAQGLADAVQAKIVYCEPVPSGRKKELFYGGLEVAVDQAFQQSNGHKMEIALAKAFPVLNQFHPTVRGKLAEAVVANVLIDYPVFVPSLIVDLYTRLGN